MQERADRLSAAQIPALIGSHDKTKVMFHERRSVWHLETLSIVCSLLSMLSPGSTSRTSRPKPDKSDRWRLSLISAFSRRRPPMRTDELRLLGQ